MQGMTRNGMTQIEEFQARVDALETSLGSAQNVTAAFEVELQRLNRTLPSAGREVDSMSRTVGMSFRRALDGLLFDGMKVSDALRNVTRSIVDSAFSAAMRPVQGAIGSGAQALFASLVPFANGGAFSAGRVVPFADGGIVASPVTFPMRGGSIGLMGEAGPEAIMPLTRGADGRLGVQSVGQARPLNVTINVATPDVEGFRRSETQIAAQIGRLIARGQKNR
jgi:lambda family phage tail tape measure protein